MANSKHLLAVTCLLSTCVLALPSEFVMASDIDKLKSLATQQDGAIRTFHVKRVITKERIKISGLSEKIKQIDPAMEGILTANQIIRSRSEAWCDLDKMRWAIAATDLRDLTKLAEEFGIESDHRPRLSQSRTMLGGDKDYFVTWQPERVPQTLVIFPKPDGRKMHWDILGLPMLGIVPHKHLVPGERTVAIHFTGQDAGTRDLVIPGSSEAPRIIYHVDPSLGYRYREVEHRSEKGVVTRRRILTDYRQVGQFHYPFQIQEDVWDQDGNPVSHETVTIEEMNVNIPVAPEHLRVSIPANVMIADFVGKGGQFRCYRSFEADLDNVFDAIQRARNTTTPYYPAPSIGRTLPADAA